MHTRLPSEPKVKEGLAVCGLLSKLGLSSRAASGDAFKKAAELHLGLDTKHEAANNYTEAAQVMKRDEPRGQSCTPPQMESGRGDGWWSEDIL